MRRLLIATGAAALLAIAVVATVAAAGPMGRAGGAQSADRDLAFVQHTDIATAVAQGQTFSDYFDGAGTMRVGGPASGTLLIVQ
jgi:hypothetical protein